MTVEQATSEQQSTNKIHHFEQAVNVRIPRMNGQTSTWQDVRVGRVKDTRDKGGANKTSLYAPNGQLVGRISTSYNSFVNRAKEYDGTGFVEGRPEKTVKRLQEVEQRKAIARTETARQAQAAQDSTSHRMAQAAQAVAERSPTSSRGSSTLQYGDRLHLEIQGETVTVRLLTDRPDGEGDYECQVLNNSGASLERFRFGSDYYFPAKLLQAGQPVNPEGSLEITEGCNATFEYDEYTVTVNVLDLDQEPGKCLVRVVDPGGAWFPVGNEGLLDQDKLTVIETGNSPKPTQFPYPL